MTTHIADVVVIGGGQSALAVAFYLRRTGLDYVLLDAGSEPGGAWLRTWDSLRLFSPARWSGLPGRLPHGGDRYLDRDEFIGYLADYERHYAVRVRRPVRVLSVRRAENGDGLLIESSEGSWRARAVVSATGSWENPYLPMVAGIDRFAGNQIHSADYRSPLSFTGKRVVIVGGGNSGAQIVADLAGVAKVSWVTRRPPSFLPPEVDGRVLFGQATAQYTALAAGLPAPPPRSLGQIVQVEPVRRALESGLLESVPMFERVTEHGVRWSDGRELEADAIIWATGFRPALAPLAPLGVVDDRGRVAVNGTRALAEPRLWLVGYGDWTGFASATIIGVGRSARATVDEIARSIPPAGSVLR